jgi:hypothetical protein
LGGIVKRSLAMVCPFAIAKAFGLAAATLRYGTFNRNRYHFWFAIAQALIRRRRLRKQVQVTARATSFTLS